MNVKLLILLVLLPCNLIAQSFSGLGSTAEGFANPAPNTNFDFPLDHGPHKNYRIEWWYLTANLSGEDQTPYGIQWTLFRTARSPNEENGWLSNQIWFAHAAITTPNEHFTTERFARGGIGQAGVNAEPFEAWIDEWKLVGKTYGYTCKRIPGKEKGMFKTGNATFIIPKRSIPKNVPKTLPEPPVILVPPIITPAITINSIPTPVTPGLT